MLTKVLLIVALSFSISCFAADTTKDPIHPNTSNTSNTSNSSTDSNNLILPTQQSDSSTKKETSESSKDTDSGAGPESSNPKKQSPMVDYCRKHTC